MPQRARIDDARGGTFGDVLTPRSSRLRAKRYRRSSRVGGWTSAAVPVEREPASIHGHVIGRRSGA
jgi:hypothetical protein